jgi:hypothetical protein
MGKDNCTGCRARYQSIYWKVKRARLNNRVQMHFRRQLQHSAGEIANYRYNYREAAMIRDERKERRLNLATRASRSPSDDENENKETSCSVVCI